VIELRPTVEADLPALSRLFADRFGHPLAPEEWRWKYLQLPGEARSLLAVTAEGEIAAHAGALCLPALGLAGEEAGIWQLIDFAGSVTRSGLRPPLVELGRLLLGDLPRPADLPWIFGFPSERHFRLGERVFGYRPVSEIGTLAGELPRAAAPAGVQLAAGDSALLWEDPQGPEAIWRNTTAAGIRRSSAFLNWRYHARPHRYYRFYRLAADGEEGLAVFAFVGAEAWGAELWLPAKAEWYPSMLAVAADLAASGLRSWRFWAPSEPATSRLLAALGLRDDGERRFLGCRAAAGAGDPAAAARSFTYAMGDHDLV
jgi:hypothetical protein